MKWRGVTTGERASAQSHFLDLCAMLGEPGPTQADPTGSWYAFEKGAEKLAGGEGFADVWKRGFFAWEYKGKGRDLKAAYLFFPSGLLTGVRLIGGCPASDQCGRLRL